MNRVSVSRSLRHAGAVLLALLVAACQSSSEPGVGGRSYAINTYTVSDQQRPVVASNRSGRSVIAWESFGQDGNHLGIFARRFVNGAPEGPEFQVNTYTASRQSFPAVAMDAQGNFVIAWRSSLQGSPGGNIFAQRFAADGSRIGGEFRVGPNDSIRDSQSEPQIAMNAAGQFVIAWSNREVGALAEELGQNQQEDRWIELRTYDADGTPRIAPRRTTVRTNDRFPRAPRVAMADNGHFVAVWATAAAGTVIRAQHYDLDANALSPAYDIASASPEVDVDLASVAMTPDGKFAVAWEGFTYGYRPLGISVRRYAGPQNPLGDAMVIASPSAGLIERNSIQLTAAGDLLIAAHANDRVYVAVQREGGAVRGPYLVSHPDFASLFPAITQSAEGTALVAWQSYGQDGDGRGIRARELSWR